MGQKLSYHQWRPQVGAMATLIQLLALQLALAIHWYKPYHANLLGIGLNKVWLSFGEAATGMAIFKGIP